MLSEQRSPAEKISSPPRILIVDDDQRTCRTLGLIFEEKGYQVETAHAGAEGLEKGRKGDFNLAILDIKLPDMPGVDLIEPLKTENPTIDIIMATGYASVDTAIQALNHGATAYITKPLQLDQVLADVKEMLAKQRLIREKKRAEEALRERERQLETLMGNLPGMAYRCLNHPDWPMEFVSQGAHQLTGYMPEEIMPDGQTDYGDIIHPDDRDMVWERTQVAIRKDEPFQLEYRIITKHEGYKWVWEQGTAVDVDSQGRSILEGFVADITARKQTEAALLRRTQQLEAIRDIGLELTAHLDLDDLLHFITSRAIELVKATSGGLALYRPERNLLEYVFYLGLEPPSMKAKPGEGVVGKVWESGRAMVVDDYAAWDEPSQGWVDTIGHGAVVAAPIRWQDEILGVIVLDHNTPGIFDQDDAEILELFGAQAAVAIQNARLFQAEDRRRREAETLREVGLIISSTTDHAQVLNLILEQLKRVVTYDSAAVEIVDGDRLIIQAVDGVDHPEEVLATSFLIEEDEFVHPILYGGEVVVRDDITAHDGWVSVPGTENVHSWIGVPLQVQDRIIGLITIDHHEVGFYSQEDALVVSSFARHVAIALENARLFEQAARRMDRLESLRSIDLAINSSLDVKISLNILLDAVMEQLKVDAAAVMLYNSDLQSLEFFLGNGFLDKRGKRTSLRLGQGLAGQVALKRKKLYIPDLSQHDEPIARKELFEGVKAYYGVPLIAKGELIGVLELFHRKRIKTGLEWLSFLETLARQAAIAIDNASLFQEIQRSNLDLSRAYDTTLESWAHVLEQIQFEIEGHTGRVLKLTMRLASRLGIRGNEMTHVRRGALLHDVGKLGVPAEILRKPGPLTEEEWQAAKQHPVDAYQWLSSIQYLRPALDIPYCHHERWDGTGYPRQLAEELIPLPARIFAVVDSWDMLTHDCVYHDAWPKEKALEYIRDQARKRFDPRVVNAFLEQMKEMEGE